MRWTAIRSAFTKVWPSIVTTIACIAGVIRVISSNTSTSTAHIVISICVIVGLVSVGLAIGQGHREYKRLTTSVRATLKRDLEHGGAIRRYRLAAQSTGEQLRDVKVWVQEPNPNWLARNFPGHALHFPYRLWRQDVGPEPDGCSINASETEFFDMLRWWMSGTSSDLQVQLNNQTFQAPSDPWIVPLKIEWSVGSSELKVLIRPVQGELEVELDDSVEEQETLPLMKKSKWSRGDKLTATGAIITAIGIVVVLFVPEIRGRLGLERAVSPPVGVSKTEVTKPATPSSPAAAEVAPKVTQHMKPKVVGKRDVAGNSVMGTGNIIGDNNQVNASPAPQVQINNAPNGIAIGGGIVNNPTVFNLGPPPQPKPTVTICISQARAAEGQHQTTVMTLRTEVKIKQPWYAFFFDGPVTDGNAGMDNHAFGFTGARADKLPNPERTFWFKLISIDFGTNEWSPGEEIKVTVHSEKPVHLVKILSGSEDAGLDENIVFHCNGN